MFVAYESKFIQTVSGPVNLCYSIADMTGNAQVQHRYAVVNLDVIFSGGLKLHYYVVVA